METIPHNGLMDLQKRIAAYLEQNPTRWGSIAAEAGIDRTWPYKFMAGKIPNPTHRTLQKLATVMNRERRRRAKVSSSDRLQP